MENQTTTNQTKNHSGFGTAALVLGIIGAVLSFIPIINNVAFFLGILAVAFAIVCFAKKKQHRGSRCGNCFGSAFYYYYHCYASLGR